MSMKIQTSKQWVLPPRPKPGRKPSSEPPTTKRKAQNRAAQRAFRERKANKVQDLEQCLGELRAEKNQVEISLTNLNNDFNILKRKYAILSQGKACSNCEDLETKVAQLEKRLAEKFEEKPATAESLPTPPSNVAFDCGVCEKDDCICEAVGIKPAPQKLSPVPLKRKREEDDDEQEKEVDFTYKFNPDAKQKKLDRFLHARLLQNIGKASVTNTTSGCTRRRSQDKSDMFANNDLFKSFVGKDLNNIEPCGFCSDDSPCVCREARKEAIENQKMEEAQEIKLPPITLEKVAKQPGKLPTFHPETTVEFKKNSYECTGNPGTCLQCQTDPMSTLFCTSIASKVSDTRSTPLPEAKVKKPSESNLFIPCADAYRTLSRHEQFKKMDFNNLVGKLTTSGMKVEVQSVVAVLRDMDRNLHA